MMNHLSIAMRAFSEKPVKSGWSGGAATRAKLDELSGWTLIFDTETHTDPGQVEDERGPRQRRALVAPIRNRLARVVRGFGEIHYCPVLTSVQSRS